MGGGLETEASGEVEVVVAVEETVQLAVVPVALMVEIESIEEVAGGAHQGYFAGEIGGQEGTLAVN